MKKNAYNLDGYNIGYKEGFDDYDDVYYDDNQKTTIKKSRLRKFRDGELLRGKDQRRKKTSRRVSKFDYDFFMDYE